MRCRASKTAEAVALARATETLRPAPDRLFQDDWSPRLLGPRGHATLRLLGVPHLGPALLTLHERRWPGVRGNLLCRTCFIDDVLHSALDDGIEQVVILGAGLDSRALRLSGLERTRVFELDRAETSACKQHRLRALCGELPKHVAFVAVDFACQSLEDALSANCFDNKKRTMFICEGVTQYLAAGDVDRIFSCAAAALPGSRIAFTYIDQRVIDGSHRSPLDARLLEYVNRLDAPWIFGLLPASLDRYLAERGLRLVEDIGAAEYRLRYLQPRKRSMALYEKERTAVAAL